MRNISQFGIEQGLNITTEMKYWRNVDLCQICKLVYIVPTCTNACLTISDLKDALF